MRRAFALLLVILGTLFGQIGRSHAALDAAQMCEIQRAEYARQGIQDEPRICEYAGLSNDEAIAQMQGTGTQGQGQQSDGQTGQPGSDQQRSDQQRSDQQNADKLQGRTSQRNAQSSSNSTALGDDDDAARITPEQLCQLERSERQRLGVAREPVICEALNAPGTHPALDTAFGTMRALLEKPKEDYFYCKVILCMANPDGPDHVQECDVVLHTFKSMLRGHVTIPACPLVDVGDNGEVTPGGSVDYQGNATLAANANAQSQADYTTVARFGRLAFQTYGLLCESVDSMLEDQLRPSDALPRGVRPYGWIYGGQTNTTIARGDLQPQWWRDANPALANHPVWDTLLPWFVAFEGGANQAGLLEVQLGRMSVQVFSKREQQWRVLDFDAGWSVSMCDASGNFGACPAGATHPGPGGEPAFNIGNGTAGHGWFNSIHLPEPEDIEALTVSVEARMANDLEQGAQALFHVGADFWPSTGGAPPVNPGAGISRLVALTNSWTPITFTTLSDQTINGTGISSVKLRNNPPACAKAGIDNQGE